jgi:threonine/homoserine/homoserine lactone efflux protein
MTLATYLLYLAAVVLLIVTPGPTMLMCVTNAVNHGTRRAMTSVLGAITAVLGVMALSAAGLGALLAASETAFTAAKLAGAAYLVWLGIKTFRSSTLLSVDAPRPSGRSFYLQGFLVGASNPKAILFFAAFFPQFLDPASPMLPQFALLALTFVACELLMLTACALGVARLLPVLRASGPARWINRVCGGLFALMGGLLLLTRRQA